MNTRFDMLHQALVIGVITREQRRGKTERDLPAALMRIGQSGGNQRHLGVSVALGQFGQFHKAGAEWQKGISSVFGGRGWVNVGIGLWEDEQCFALTQQANGIPDRVAQIPPGFAGGICAVSRAMLLV